MKKIVHFIDKNLEEIILSIMMAYFVFATAFQVLARFILKMSAPWTEESARFVLIWMSFVGCSYAAKKGSHIRVDILESSLGKTGGRILKNIAFAIFIIFTLIMTVAGVQICQAQIATPQYSSVMNLPLIVVNAALPVGMLMTTLRLIQWLIKDNMGGEAK